MAPLSHIKIQLKVLRYSSSVIQGLFQLGGWEQCVEQMGGGALTLLVTGVQVRSCTLFSLLQVTVIFFFFTCHPHLFLPQSTVVILLFQEMAPLNHIKTQLRELRYSSDVTQGLFQLGGWGQCVEQMGGGSLILPLLCAHVWYFKHGPNVMWLVPHVGHFRVNLPASISSASPDIYHFRYTTKHASHVLIGYF